MRYSSDHKAKTRERILSAAATVFRREGFQAASVDQIMAEAGLTPGGFYAHFNSKHELFAEAFLHTLQASRTLMSGAASDQDGADRIMSIARHYLSTPHCQRIEQGCVLPPLLADLPRQGDAARQKFQQIMQEILAEWKLHLTDSPLLNGPDDAWAMLSLLVGGIVISRAVAEPECADRILAACRQLLERAVTPPGLSASTPSEPSRD